SALSTPYSSRFSMLLFETFDELIGKLEDVNKFSSEKIEGYSLCGLPPSCAETLLSADLRLDMIWNGDLSFFHWP
ncbi:MAG: hypothetical protein QF728_03985, partial [Arenicellales bacterium]|nr:hypothetical protein [Arenicellales bacterium]